MEKKERKSLQFAGSDHNGFIEHDGTYIYVFETDEILGEISTDGKKGIYCIKCKELVTEKEIKERDYWRWLDSFDGYTVGDSKLYPLCLKCKIPTDRKVIEENIKEIQETMETLLAFLSNPICLRNLETFRARLIVCTNYLSSLKLKLEI